MRIKDIMTYNVVTITSSTPIIEAERILTAHGFERLPVVDMGKLVGLVTKDNVLKAGPSAATTLTRGEAVYLLTRLTVSEVMKRNVVTVSPETTVEKAVAVAQANKVGCLPVLEGEQGGGDRHDERLLLQDPQPSLRIGPERDPAEGVRRGRPEEHGEGAWGGQQVRPHHQQHLETARGFAEERPDHSVQ